MKGWFKRSVLFLLLFLLNGAVFANNRHLVDAYEDVGGITYSPLTAANGSENLTGAERLFALEGVNVVTGNGLKGGDLEFWRLSGGGEIVRFIDRSGVWATFLNRIETAYPNLKAHLLSNYDPATRVRFAEDFGNAADDVLGQLDGDVGLVGGWRVLSGASSALSSDIQVLIICKLLKSKGLNEIQLVNIGSLDDLSAFEIAENFLTHSDELVNDIDEIITKIYAANTQSELVTWSSQYGINADLIGQLKKLSTFSNFDQPQTLVPYILDKLAKRFDNPGYLAQFNETILHLETGDVIRMESGGDILNVTKSEAFQYKAVTSAGSDKLFSNLKSATKQFSTEIPPNGYLKVVKVRLFNTAQIDFNSTINTLKNRMQTYYDANRFNSVGLNLRDLDRIEIVNEQGTHKFRVINHQIEVVL